MHKKPREVFLANLLSDLDSRYPDWQIKDHCRIEIEGQPGNLWPQADILISMPGRRFIIEYDEDSDPGRSLVKYWPVLDESNHAITIIEVWKGGQTVGRSYATLAKWDTFNIEASIRGSRSSGARLDVAFSDLVTRFVYCGTLNKHIPLCVYKFGLIALSDVRLTVG